jgi:phosphopantothenate synthetase
MAVRNTVRGAKVKTIDCVVRALSSGLRAQAELAGWQPGRSQRVVSSFYISQAMELARR